MSLNSSYADEHGQKPLAIVSLEMGDSIEKIKVFEGEDVELLAELFCQRYKLGHEVVQYIVEAIEAQLHQNRQKKENSQSPRFPDNQVEAKKPPQQLQNSQAPKQAPQVKTQDIGPMMVIGSDSDKKNDNSAKDVYEKWQSQLKHDYNQTPGQTNQKNMITWTSNHGHKTPQQIQVDNNKKGINDRLYREGIDKIKTKTENAEQYREYRSNLEMQKATFHPMISPKSREMINQKRQSNPVHNFGVALQQRGAELNQHKQEQIQKHREEIRKQSPFQPNINRNTSPNQQARSTTPIHKKLYEQGREEQRKKEQWQQEEFKKQCPFQPKSRSPILATRKSQDQLDAKLYNDFRERNQRQEMRKHYDNLKQQELQPFNPKINKDVNYLKVSRRTNLQDVQLAQELLSTRSTKPTTFKSTQSLHGEGSLHRMNAISKAQLVSPKASRSQQAISQFDLVVQRIFIQLDSDRDGEISCDKLDLNQVSGDVLDIISEVLYEMEENQLVLNLAQFRNMCLSHKLEEQLLKF